MLDVQNYNTYSAVLGKIIELCKNKNGIPFKVEYPKNIKKIHEAVNLLQKGELLPERFCDHELTGNYAGHRECKNLHN